MRQLRRVYVSSLIPNLLVAATVACALALLTLPLSAATGEALVTMGPCRAVDTRGPAGPHEPVIVRIRVSFAPSAGPPSGPSAECAAP